MSVYRTLIIAGFVTLSANAAMAQSGAGGRDGGRADHDGKANQRIRDENFNAARGPFLREGRASVFEAAPFLNPRYYRRYRSRRY